MSYQAFLERGYEQANPYARDYWEEENASFANKELIVNGMMEAMADITIGYPYGERLRITLLEEVSKWDDEGVCNAAVSLELIPSFQSYMEGD